MEIIESNKTEKLRVCKRCLLSELSESSYYEKIRMIIGNMDASQKTSDNEYERRLSICKECDRLREGTCLACGCFVELRAVTKKSQCPYKRW